MADSVYASLFWTGCSFETVRKITLIIRKSTNHF